MTAIPQHVAIIMDGNARWARANNVALRQGHRKGAEALKALLEPTKALGVQYVSVYAFSQENWGRPESEVNALMHLLDWYLRREITTLIESDVRLKISGDLSRFSKKIQDYMHQAMERTAHLDALTLNICLNYGARQEITHAAKTLAAQCSAGTLSADDITPELMHQQLYTHDLPDPDLLIRTGGDTRISNFLLWQCAYSELYFTDILWPDFDGDALRAACNAFGTRERRYGKR